jgi:hypothetical protein
MHYFDHKRPVRDKDGQIVTLKEGPAVRKTRGTLPAYFGIDRNKHLIVSLEAGDLICLRIAGTQRVKKISAFDVYHYVIRKESLAIQLEKAREKKTKKAERLARQRQERAEKRLFKKD